MRSWLRNIIDVVVTVAKAMLVSIRCWVRTYDPKRRTFTEHYEFPELPVSVPARTRGFHRYQLTTCVACDACARACPADCIYIGREKVPGKKGFQITSFTIDYTKCMFCGMCTEGCKFGGLAMGSSHDLSCYSRDGCIVDFSRLPPEVAWGATSLNPTVVAHGKRITQPVPRESAETEC